MSKRKLAPVDGNPVRPSADEIQDVDGTSLRTSTKKRKHQSEAEVKPPRPHGKRDDVVSRTNALRSEDFVSSFLPSSLLRYPNEDTTSGRYSHTTYEISFHYARDLPPDHLQDCLKLIETTSMPDYRSSIFGWNAKRKLKEMRQAEMRYLTAWRSRTMDPTDDVDDGLQGFLSFMVTHEDGIAIVYIYEIHLAETARGNGLGRHLMHAALRIAQEIGTEIKKVMLTCFTCNTIALAFYARLGYDIDESSPPAREIRGKIIMPDYVIMSKIVDAS